MRAELRSAVGTGAVLLALAGLLAVLRVQPSARLPQGQVGEDVLSVLLGDAKKDISASMVRTADSYFHGGVDIDCHLDDHDHDEHACGEGAACPHHGHDHHDHDHPEDDAERVVTSNLHFDPWRWINGHVRAPEIDRHLEGEKAKEMLPWFWMAVRSNPHNIEAWTTAWYAAARIMKDSQLALKVAHEACRANPDNLEVLCILGRTYRIEGLRDDVQAIAAFSKAREKGLLASSGNPSELSEEDKDLFLQALDYLSVYAVEKKNRGDLERLLNDARRTTTEHPVVGNIARRLKQLNP